MKKLNSLSQFNILLFGLIFIYVFIVGLLPEQNFTNEIYNVIFTAIYVVAAKIISKRRSKAYFIYAGITIFTIWLAEFLNLHILAFASAVISIVFLLLTISLMIIRIAKSNEVSLLEFVEAINVYLLIGIIGSILFRVVYTILPGESFNIPGESLIPTTDFIYFSFVTLSTVGYGDITPIDPFAKSLSIFLSISGQLYLTMIIAVLVGKYISAKQK